MHYLLCTHRVADYAGWRRVFDRHAEAQRRAGLELLHVLRDGGDPELVVLLFRAADPAAARAFTSAPEAADAGRESGVIGTPELLLLHD